MKKNILKQIDLSFLPEEIEQEVKDNLGKALRGLEGINWPIKAVILGGGYKHKEITFSQKHLGSDIDLFIFSNFIPFFWKKLTKIQNEINKNNFFFHYRGVIPLFFSRSKTFWAYKLKNEGIILKGDKDILKNIKADRCNISKIEAIRILFQTLNRHIRINESKDDISQENSSLFTILRVYLNIGESYLTFFECLQPSYNRRLEEFQSRVHRFDIEETIKEKIILGYLTKINPEKVKAECNDDDFSLKQAKEDCIKQINHLLSLYIERQASTGEKLDILEKSIKPKLFYNFVLFRELKNLRGVKPKFFPIVFQFKVIDFWKIAIYSQDQREEKKMEILKKYFYIHEFSEEILTKILGARPFPTIIEIN